MPAATTAIDATGGRGLLILAAAMLIGLLLSLTTVLHPMLAAGDGRLCGAGAFG